MKTVLKFSRDLMILGLIAVAAYFVGRESSGNPALAGVADSNQDMIAVTGQFGTGTSVLYLIDTRAKALLVYEARGGSQSDLKLVAARDITYDLKVRSYNDVTEPSMKVDELERRWRQFSSRRRAGGQPQSPGTQKMKKAGSGEPGGTPPEDPSKKTETEKTEPKKK